MRGWPATLIAAIIVITLPLAFIGCKKRGDTESSVAEHEDHEGHDDDQGEDEPPGTESDRPSDAMGPGAEAIVKSLQADDDQTVINALEQVRQMKSQSQRDEVKDYVKKLILDERVSGEVRTAAVGTWEPWAAAEPEPALSVIDSPHATVRAAAAGVLRGAEGPEVVEALKKLKQDEESTVRAIAAEVLADHLARATSDEIALDLLIADLGDPEGDLSAQAAMKLEQRGRTDRQVVEKLIRALQTSGNPMARHSCATVLGLTCAGTSPGQQAFAATVKVTYRQDANPDEAYDAPVPALIEALESDTDAMVREAAAFALGMIGSEESAPAIGKALRDDDTHVRRRAAAALVVVPPDSVKDELIDSAQNDPSPEVRRAAVEAMTNLRMKTREDRNEAGEAVALCLQDVDPEVRRYAAEVLKRIGTRLQTEALVKLFEDSYEDVRWKAVDTVAQFADPRAKKALIAALNDPSPRVALAAERGVHRLGIGTRVLTKAERGGGRQR